MSELDVLDISKIEQNKTMERMEQREQAICHWSGQFFQIYDYFFLSNCALKKTNEQTKKTNHGCAGYQILLVSLQHLLESVSSNLQRPSHMENHPTLDHIHAVKPRREFLSFFKVDTSNSLETSYRIGQFSSLYASIFDYDHKLWCML